MLFPFLNDYENATCPDSLDNKDLALTLKGPFTKKKNFTVDSA